MSLPPRNHDTMSEAIALSSPSGRMSKRAKTVAERRLAFSLFGEHCTREDIQGTPAEELPGNSLRRSAANLRALAAKGMHVRKYPREAERLEREAEIIDAAWREKGK